MIKVSVFFPNQEGKRFNLAYCLERHLPLVRSLLGSSLMNMTFDQGMSGLTPGAPPSFLAMGHMYFASLDDFQAALAQHGPAIIADVPNFTDVDYLVQISEVIV